MSDDTIDPTPFEAIKEESEDTNSKLYKVCLLLSDSNTVQGTMLSKSDETLEILRDISASLAGQLSLAQQEALEKGRDLPDGDDPGASPKSENPFEKFKMKTVSDGILGTIGILGGIFLGFVTQFAKLTILAALWFGKKGLIMLGFRKLFNSILKTKFVGNIVNLSIRVSEFFAKMGSAVMGMVAKIKNLGKGIGQNKWVTRIIKGFNMLKSGVLWIFRGIGRLVMFLFKPIALMVDVIKKISSAVSKGFKFIKPFLFLGGTIGKLLAKIAWPITVFISAFKGMTDAIDAFKNSDGSFLEKLGAGLGAFIKTFFNTLIFDLLDMVKNGFSWVAKKIFGEDNAISSFLDGFSFSEMFSGLVDGIGDVIKDIKDWVVKVKDWIVGLIPDWAKRWANSMDDKEKVPHNPHLAPDYDGPAPVAGLAPGQEPPERGWKLSDMWSGDGDDDAMMDAIKSDSKTMDAGEAAQAKVKADASKEKRDAHLATIPPEEISAIKSEMGVSKLTDQALIDTYKSAQMDVQSTKIPKRSALTKVDIIEKELKIRGLNRNGENKEAAAAKARQDAFKESGGAPESALSMLSPNAEGEANIKSRIGAGKPKVVTNGDNLIERSNVVPLVGGPLVDDYSKGLLVPNGSAVKQGESLSSGTHRMSEGKSKQNAANSNVANVVNAPTPSSVVNNSNVTQSPSPATHDDSDKTMRSSPMKR